MDRVVGRWGPRLPRRLERRAIDESEEETTTTTTTRRARTSRTTAEEEEEETTSSGAGTKATRTRTTTTTASTTSVAAKQATRMAAVDTEEGAEDSTTEIVATTIDTGALASAATSIPLAVRSPFLLSSLLLLARSLDVLTRRPLRFADCNNDSNQNRYCFSCVINFDENTLWLSIT